MKSLISIFFVLTITSCSFDNKTGIWNDADNIPVDNKQAKSIDESTPQSQYEEIFVKDQEFNEEKIVSNKLTLLLDEVTVIDNWLEQYGNNSNNVSNYSYSGDNILLTKSPKLNKLLSNENTIFYENNLIGFDHKGKIFIYSLDTRKKIFEYNFYKKSFKKFKKKIYLIAKKNILYAADNLGYLYAINLDTKSLVWAKNYGIPFRSNLKIIEEQIFLANQDNLVYSIDTKTGNKNWQFGSRLTFLKSEFNNNFAVDEIGKNLIFLNTSGELYSFNYINQNINWVINFKNSFSTSEINLFISNPIIIKNNILIVSTENSTFSYNTITGARNWRFPSNSIIKPIITNNYTYILSKNNLLICLNIETGEVIWSKNILKNLRIKKINKIGSFYDFKIVNNEVNLYSKNGYLLSFNYKNGNNNYIKKISKNGISSKIFFLKQNMLLLDNNSRLLKFN
jgi:outer membrane protein assembly factor BamB